MRQLLLTLSLSISFFSAYAAANDCNQYQNPNVANACRNLAAESRQAQQNVTNTLNANIQKYQQPITQVPNNYAMPTQTAPQQQIKPQTPTTVTQQQPEQKPAKPRSRIHY